MDAFSSRAFDLTMTSQHSSGRYEGADGVGGSASHTRESGHEHVRLRACLHTGARTMTHGQELQLLQRSLEQLPSSARPEAPSRITLATSNTTARTNKLKPHACNACSHARMCGDAGGRQGGMQKAGREGEGGRDAGRQAGWQAGKQAGRQAGRQAGSLGS